MTTKDYIYIFFILIAGVCGAMLNSRTGEEKIDPIEKDTHTKERELLRLKLSYDSLNSVNIKINHRLTEDSIKYCNRIAAFNLKVLNLNRKINEISFKGYSNRKLDSLINNLYGDRSIFRTGDTGQTGTIYRTDNGSN